MGGLIFGMVRVLVNWWAYTWGGFIFGGGLYSEVYGIYIVCSQPEVAEDAVTTEQHYHAQHSTACQQVVDG